MAIGDLISDLQIDLHP